MRTDLPNNKYDFFKLFNKRKKINDSKLSKIFNDDFKLEIKKRKGLKIVLFNDIYKNFSNNNFTSKITFKDFQNLDFEIEFPINHLNVSSMKKKWQVETGPVLLPLIFKKNNKFDLLPSFVIFNKFDSVDIFYDYPFGFRNRKNLI